MKTGIELITEERREQLEKHGRTIEDDKVLNKRRQLRSAAYMLISEQAFIMDAPEGWDEKIWDKMRRKALKERLIIAGALIAAEIDRILPDKGEKE